MGPGMRTFTANIATRAALSDEGRGLLAIGVRRQRGQSLVETLVGLLVRTLLAPSLWRKRLSRKTLYRGNSASSGYSCVNV